MYKCNGNRMWGWYRAIAGKSYTKIMSQLSMSLRAWGDGCFSVGRSCGTMFQLAGVGDGELTNEPMSMGPFFFD